MFCGIHPRAIPQEVLINFIRKVSSDITFFKLRHIPQYGNKVEMCQPYCTAFSLRCRANFFVRCISNFHISACYKLYFIRFTRDAEIFTVLHHMICDYEHIISEACSSTIISVLSIDPNYDPAKTLYMLDSKIRLSGRTPLITGNSILYRTACSGLEQRKYQHTALMELFERNPPVTPITVTS